MSEDELREHPIGKEHEEILERRLHGMETTYVVRIKNRRKTVG